MKIGILTLPLVDNYGGILQVIALYKFLESEKHEVVLIDKRLDVPIWKKIAKYILSLMMPNKFDSRKEKERKKLHEVFIDNEIKQRSYELISFNELKNYVQEEQYNAIIVGSDQVWRKSYINDQYYKSYFLDSKLTKKVAYAASFGKDYWEGKNDTLEISELLDDFTAVSVRELSALDICSNVFKLNSVQLVLDPTLLHTKEFYYNTIISKYETSYLLKGGLVTYVLDEEAEKKTIIEFIQKEKEIKNTNHLKGFKKSVYTYSIPEWLMLLYYADFVIVDSFHGMVFSILFQKQFIVIGNPSRGLSRFQSLLSILELETRLISNLAELQDISLDSIDYETVNLKLESLRKTSKDFLLNSLNGNI